MKKKNRECCIVSGCACGSTWNDFLCRKLCDERIAL